MTQTVSTPPAFGAHSGSTTGRLASSAEEVVARVASVVPSIAAEAVQRDRDRVLAREQIDELSSVGAFAVTVPHEFGGAGGGASHAFEVTRLLATADPNVAQIPQSHFVYLRLAEIAGSEALKQHLFAEVVAGRRIANAQSERGGQTVADLRTRTWNEGGEAVVEGEKFYATGSLLADWIAVLARDSEGVEKVGFVLADSPGISIIDDWTGMGQRTTASGTVRFDGVRLPQAHVVPRADAVTGPYGYGALAQGLHAAIDTGIARGALTEAAQFVRTSARPWHEAGVAQAHDDPLLAQRFGELEVEVRAAEAALTVAGRAVDTVVELGTDDAAVEASLAVGAAKVLADRAALSVTSALFELGGTRSSDDSLDLHRHWRNARTHTLHDPVRWKIHHLGRWAVRGEIPPRGPHF